MDLFNKELMDMVTASLVATVDSHSHECMFHSRGPNKELAKYLSDYGIICRHVKQHGGEGMGDDYYSIYSFSKDGDTVFVEFNGWYYSYDGATFSEWYFVKAAVVQEVQYVKLNK